MNWVDAPQQVLSQGPLPGPDWLMIVLCVWVVGVVVSFFLVTLGGADELGRYSWGDFARLAFHLAVWPFWFVVISFWSGVMAVEEIYDRIKKHKRRERANASMSSLREPE